MRRRAAWTTAARVEAARRLGAIGGEGWRVVAARAVVVGPDRFNRLLGATGTPSPLLAVAGAFVDRTPAWLKDWAVATFGTADKIALGVGMGLVLVVVTALVGVLGRTSRALAVGLAIGFIKSKGYKEVPDAFKKSMM